MVSSGSIADKPSTGDSVQVLVTVFACSPDHGSEPGIGWGWVMALSKVCDLTVLTTSVNRAGIEAYQTREGKVSAKFVYEDICSFSARLNRKAKSKIGVLVRLLMWQRRIKKRLRQLIVEDHSQVVHHITLGSYRMPFSVTGIGVASVVGPVGGCEIFPRHLLPDGEPKICARELIRNTITLLHNKYGLGMARYKSADLTLSCTREMHRVFSKWGVDSPVFPNIGMHHDQVVSIPKSYRDIGCDGGLKLLFVGNLLYWKGLELAVLCMKLLPERVTLCCVGGGADRAPLEALIQKHNLDHRIEIAGSVARDELLEKYATFDVFLFPSLHDSGGMVVIEAMRAGLPVVCLDAGGPALSVTPECGRVVPLGSKREVTEGLRQSILHYLETPTDIAVHGQRARQRVIDEYDWDKNAVRMVEYYQSIV